MRSALHASSHCRSPALSRNRSTRRRRWARRGRSSLPRRTSRRSTTACASWWRSGRGLPLVTAQLVIRSGAETDPPQLAGLADITATLLTKGTAKRTAPQIAEAAEALGGHARKRRRLGSLVRSAMTVTRPQLAAALALIAEVALQPRFARPSSSARAGWRWTACRSRCAIPGTLAAHGGGPRGVRRRRVRPSCGRHAGVARARARGDVVAQHARWYRPDNATLIFAGDIECQGSASRSRGRRSATWKRPAAARPAARARRCAVGTACAGRDRDARRRAGRRGDGGADDRARPRPTTIAGVVANTLLGGGYSSRLNQELRIRRGLDLRDRQPARRAHGRRRVEHRARRPRTSRRPSWSRWSWTRSSASATPPRPPTSSRRASSAIIGSVSRRFETTEDLAATLASFEANGDAASSSSRARSTGSRP